MVFIAVRQNRSMVLCAEICLYSLPVSRATGEDILAGSIRADERDRLDGGFIKDEINRLCGAMDNIDNPVGEASLLTQLGKDHRGAGIPLRGLQNQGIAACGCDRNTPQWDHGGEVKGTNGSDHTKRLAI